MHTFGEWIIKVFDHPDAAGCLIIAVKTLVIYVFLIAGLRLLGKRELGQMNMQDLVLIIVLGNAVQNAMMNNDNSLVGGLIAATVLLVVNRIFASIIRHSRRVEQAMVGHAVLLVNNGTQMEANMRREGITHEQLEQALREHGICQIADARMCVLEVDGTISVVPKEADVTRIRRHFKALRM